MKVQNLLRIGIMLILSIKLIAIHSQPNSQIGMAKVEKRMDYEIYILTEPQRSYEKKFTVKVNTFVVNIPDKGDLNSNQTKLRKVSRNLTISDKVSQFAALVEEQDQDKEVDAIIYSGGQIATAIKFTDANLSNKGVGKVKNESGVDLFVLNKPVYPRLKKKRKWTHFGRKRGFLKKFNQIISEDTSIETDIYNFLRIVAKGKPKKWPDGLIVHASGLIQGFKYKPQWRLII